MNLLNKIELTDWYRLFYEFVKYFPSQSNRCKRLQTFAVLEEFADLNAENLAKTVKEKDKTYFFSRKWARSQHNPSKISFDYPVMVVFEKSAKMSDTFVKEVTICHNVDIAFLDKYDDGCAGDPDCDNPCNSRNKSEIYEDTEVFMRLFLEYMRNVVYTDRLINNAVNQSLDIPGTVNDALTRKFQKLLKDGNLEDLNMMRYDHNKDNLYGVYFSMNLCKKLCQEFTYDPNIVDFKVTYDEGCC